MNSSMNFLSSGKKKLPCTSLTILSVTVNPIRCMVIYSAFSRDLLYVFLFITTYKITITIVSACTMFNVARVSISNKLFTYFNKSISLPHINVSEITREVFHLKWHEKETPMYVITLSQKCFFGKKAKNIWIGTI